MIVPLTWNIFWQPEKNQWKKGLINLAMAGPQEIFKQHLIKNEEQPSFSKRYSAHFGEVSTITQGKGSILTPQKIAEAFILLQTCLN